MQAFCRLADALPLPTHRDLQQYYGGKQRMPQNAWADYWLTNIASDVGHSRKDVAFLRGEGDFRKEMDGTEEWITRGLVRCRFCWSSCLFVSQEWVTRGLVRCRCLWKCRLVVAQG